MHQRWSKQHLYDLLSKNAAIIVLVSLATCLCLADLGGDYLWADEGDTAALALGILKTGLPTAWDGVTFSDSDFGARLNDNLVMVSHPWVQYYATAASFLLFGETPFAARFPFAMCGPLTVLLLYFLVLRTTSDKRAALSASILLTISVQFLLYSRQSRNYAPNMALTLLLLWYFFQLTNRRNCILFCITAITLFHTSPSGVAPLGALAVLTLFYPPFAQYRRWFWKGVPFILAGVVPWFFVASHGYEHNSMILDDWATLPWRMIQFCIEWSSVTPAVGVVVLFAWLWWRRHIQTIPKGKTFSFQAGRQTSITLFSPNERDFVVASGALIFVYACLVALTQPRMNMFNFGLRWVTPVIPLTGGLVGLFVSKACKSNLKVWFALMLLLGVTKLGRISPWTFVDQPRAAFGESDLIALHVPSGWSNKLFRTELISFMRELWHENRGTVAAICSFLKDHARPGDILITNYCWESVYFHTRLPQGLKIMPDYQIYEAARRKGLPQYVFGVQGARWLIWRIPWADYRSYNPDEILKDLGRAGATLTRVASVPETRWENRPELHFHRFPNKEYKYPWFPDDGPGVAFIYRIDWPWEKPQAAAR